jgi:REP element-mobilizing transposase RayT
MILELNPLIAEILTKDWELAPKYYGWAVGEYVIMPDHVHFFCRETSTSKFTLSEFVGRWKQFSARKVGIQLSGESFKLWQAGFFDRLMRNESEWEQKRLYMLDNPVRAGLVTQHEDWPFWGDLDIFREHHAG